MSQKRILWIDDESDGPLVERKNRLESTGFRLINAYNATEAENLIKSEDYDLYLVDIRLKPGDDDKWLSKYGAQNERLGIELLELILIKLNGDYTKIIIYTIETWEDIEPLFLTLGKQLEKQHYLNKNENNHLRSLVKFIGKILGNPY